VAKIDDLTTARDPMAVLRTGIASRFPRSLSNSTPARAEIGQKSGSRRRQIVFFGQLRRASWIAIDGTGVRREGRRNSGADVKGPP